MSKKTLLNESTVRQFMKYANLGGLTDNFINETYMKEEEVEEGKRGKRRPTGPKKEGEKPLEEGEMEEGHEEGHMAEEEQMDEVAPLAAMAPAVARGAVKLGAKALQNPAVRKAAGAAVKGAVGSMMGGDEKNEGHHMEEGEMEEGSHLGEMSYGMEEDADMEEGKHELEEAAHEGGEDAPEDEDADPVGGDDPELTDRLEQAAKKAAQALLDALGVEGEVSVDGAGEDDMGDMGGMDDDEGMPPMDDDEGEVLDELDILDEDEIVNETMKRVMKRLSAMNESRKAAAKKDQIIESVADSIIARLRAKK